MLKSIINLKDAQIISRSEQKTIMGGTPVQPADCACFCTDRSTHQKVAAYCFSYCPDGSVPGIEEGSTGKCGPVVNPKPEI